MADDERFHTCDSVLRRCSGESESSNHDSVHYKIHLPKLCGWALSFQNLEVVAVIRGIINGITLLQSPGDLFSDRASPASIRILPRQAVLLTRRTDDSSRVLVYIRVVVLFQSVFLLRLH